MTQSDKRDTQPFVQDVALITEDVAITESGLISVIW